MARARRPALLYPTLSCLACILAAVLATPMAAWAAGSTSTSSSPSPSSTSASTSKSTSATTSTSVAASSGAKGGVPAFTGPITTAPPLGSWPLTSDRCVFVLGTGRSGSSALTDAINQLPNHMVRGEQEGAMYHLYNMYRNLIRAYHHSDEYRSFVSSLAAKASAQASTGGSPSTGSSSRPRRILRGNGVDEDLLAADSASVDADLQTDSDSIFRVDEQGPMLSWRKLQGDKHHHFRHAHSKHSGSGSHHSGSKSGSHHSGSAHKSDLDLDLAAGTSKQLLEHPAATAAGDSWAALPLGARLGLPTVKGLYESVATRRKEPWFNDLHPERAMLGVRALYTATYGYLGKDVVSGFKEIRYVRGNSFRTEASYKEFEEFMAFLSGICNDVKFVLNTRNTSDLAANIKLKEMYNRDAKFDQVFESNMRATHAWFDQYAKDHPTKAIRVLMEDMFDAERSPDLARRLVSFLGADPDQNPIRFDRMPTCVGSC